MDAHAALTLTDDNFEAEVKNFSGVVLVDFWAAWCPPCVMMGPMIEQLAQKYTGNPQIKIAKLDVDAHPATTQEFGVMSLPTFLIFANGQDVNSIVGAGPVTKLDEAIQNALQQLAPATAKAA